MKPTPDQQRPVLSIDLGASYTKLAWRSAWKWAEKATDDENRFSAHSLLINLYPDLNEEGYLIPSLAYDPKDGSGWLFGKDAAGMTPTTISCLHSNWKSTLFNEDLDDESSEVVCAIQVATKFLEWLRTRIEPKYPSAEANTRVCVPAFAQKIVGLRRLLRAFESAGWTHNAFLEVTEPKANLVGFASSGRNRVKAVRTEINGPVPDWKTMFGGENTPVLRTLRAQTLTNNPPEKWCVIDIGAFTTDIAVCEIDTPIKVKVQKSYYHGLAKIDDLLKRMLDERGLQVSDESHDYLDSVKRSLYSGRLYTFVVQYRLISLDKADLETIEGWLTTFSKDLLTMANNHLEGINGYVLTGGPSNISAISDTISAGFRKRAPNVREVSNSFSIEPNIGNLKRLATALGGASVIIDFDDTEDSANRGHVLPPQPLPGQMCSCLGGNKNCIRCDGKGWRSTAEKRGLMSRQETESADESSLSSTGSIKRAAVKGSAPELQIGQPNPLPQAVPRPHPRSKAQKQFAPEKVAPLTIEQLVKSWQRSKRSTLEECSLGGWMGDFVFGKTVRDQDIRKSYLAAPSSPMGQAAWLRLLCLGCCLSARIQRSTLKRFWEVELPQVWEVLIPTVGEQVKPKEKLESFFIMAIHKQFKNRNASEEDAELWRRVFYDFRKMHEFVYQNDLAGALLDLVREPGLEWSSLAHFLKSGFLPAGVNAWCGVIGQSMTSPILFILRELRRLDIMDGRFDASCYYMNTAARRVACGLGWITHREVLTTDFDGLVSLSHKCYKRMRAEAPDLLPWFDLPLQILQIKRSKKR